MINNKPNVFQFATQELSQDAVLLYFADCYNYNPTKKIGEEFIKQLGCEIYGLKAVYPIKQYNKIDILLVLDYQDHYDLLVIEDKTSTSAHDNQLEKYKNMIDDCSTFGYDKLQIATKRVNNRMYVYFKPLVYNENEMAANEARGYKIISNAHLQNVLEIECDDPIFNEYKRYYFWRHEKDLSIINAISLEDLNKISLDDIMSSYIGQWKLVELLLSHDNSFRINRMYQGSSYGRPWTQYRFVFDMNCENSSWYNINLNDECRGRYSYFFRLDRDTKGYYISCRQYIYDTVMANEAEKLQEITDIIQELEQAGINYLKKGKGKKETDLWLYHFNCIDDLISVKDEISKIQAIIIKSNSRK